MLKSKKSRDTMLACIGFLAFLAIWSALSAVLGSLRLPSPWAALEEMVKTVNECPLIKYQGAGEEGFLPHVLISTERFVVGSLAGIALSLVMLLACARYQVVMDLVFPVVDVVRTIPPLATAPFLILWFGASQVSIMLVPILYTFVTVFIAGVEAMKRIDPAYINFARTLGAKKTTITREVIFPALFPALAGPIKIAVCSSWGLVIIGEQLGASAGLGRIMNLFSGLSKTTLIMVCIFWVLLMALIAEIVVSLVIGYITRWTPKTTEE